MRPPFRAFTAPYLPLIAGFAAALLLLTLVAPVLAAEGVPSGAQKALAPVTKMIATLVAIAIGLGIASLSNRRPARIIGAATAALGLFLMAG